MYIIYIYLYVYIYMYIYIYIYIYIYKNNLRDLFSFMRINIRELI